MARSAAFASLGTTRTTFFQSDKDVARQGVAATSSGVTRPGDGQPTRGFWVHPLSTNAVNTLVYVNGVIVGTVQPGQMRDFLSISNDKTATGGQLEIAAASSTVGGTYGTVDG